MTLLFGETSALLATQSDPSPRTPQEQEAIQGGAVSQIRGDK